MVWALLPARIFEILPLRGGLCGAQMRLIALVTDLLAVKTILAHSPRIVHALSDYCAGSARDLTSVRTDICDAR
jgi:hypothetical protein